VAKKKKKSALLHIKKSRQRPQCRGEKTSPRAKASLREPTTQKAWGKKGTLAINNASLFLTGGRAKGRGKLGAKGAHPTKRSSQKLLRGKEKCTTTAENLEIFKKI